MGKFPQNALMLAEIKDAFFGSMTTAAVTATGLEGMEHGSLHGWHNNLVFLGFSISGSPFSTETSTKKPI